MEIPDNIKNLPVPFNLYRSIVSSDHLHFGMWPEEKPELTMEEAQQIMFEKLISFLPEPPASILDVGCGLGISAHLLALKGYEVTAIAPSPELISYAKQKYDNSNINFMVQDFLDTEGSFPAKESFDILFFQESMQYLSPLELAIKRSRHLLKNGGLIIIGDEVCYDLSIKSNTAVHMSKEYIVSLSENGFRITKNLKLGKNVMSMYDFIIDRLSKNFDRLVNMFKDTDSDKTLYALLDRWKKQKLWYSKKQMGYEIFAAKKDAYFIRQYNSGNEHDILLMFNAVFNADRNLEHWYWKYRDNPYGSGKISLGYSSDDTILSHFAGYPVQFCFIGAGGTTETFTAIHCGDTMTHRSARRIGLGKTGLLARTTFHFYATFCEGYVPFAYGFNTGNIKKMGERYLEYEYIDPVTLWVKDVNHHPVNVPGPLFRFFSGFSVEEVHSVDHEWDDFFTRVCPSYRFLTKRDSTYLSWRYLDCPDKVHRVFAVRKRGRLAGWSVFTKKENRLIWGDALFDKQYPQTVSYLLYRLLDEYFQDTDIIEGWFSTHPEWWSTLLTSIGFEMKNEQNHLTPCFHILPNKIFDEQSVMEKMNRLLYYTEGDSDLF